MRYFPKAAVIAIFTACLAWTAGAVPITYDATLSGPAEDPPNASPGTGSAVVTIDTTAHTLQVSFDFSGLLGTTTAAHIHAPTPLPLEGIAGVATTVPTFAGTPLGVTSGSLDLLLDLTQASSFNPAFVTANGGTVASAEAALASALDQGRAYLNIHTSQFPGGEIRGFLTPIPLPAALTMLAAGVLMLAGAAGFRRSA